MSLREHEDWHTQSHIENEVDVAPQDISATHDPILIQDVSQADEVNLRARMINIESRRRLRKHHLAGRTGTTTYTVDSTTTFMNEIGRYPLLNGREEERELAMAIEAGKSASFKLADELYESDSEKNYLEQLVVSGKQSKERFLLGNLRLVVSIAKNYSRPPTVDLTDVIQEGILGLEHAIEKFDYTKGFKFSTYSTNWIRQYIGRFLALRAQSVKVPDKEYSSLRRALMDSDSDNQPYDELPEKQNRILSLMNLISLDMGMGDGDTGLIDVLDNKNPGPETTALSTVATEVLYKIIDEKLDSREKKWLTMFYGLSGEEPMTLTKIANVSGVSSPTVRRVLDMAKEKLESDLSIQELGKADY